METPARSGQCASLRAYWGHHIIEHENDREGSLLVGHVAGWVRSRIVAVTEVLNST